MVNNEGENRKKKEQLSILDMATNDRKKMPVNTLGTKADSGKGSTPKKVSQAELAEAAIADVRNKALRI